MMYLMLCAVKDVATAPADVGTHVIFYALYSYYFCRSCAERKSRVDGDLCYIYNYSTSQLVIVGQMMLNELAEPLLAPNGWRPPASRTPANNGVPAVGVFAPYGAVSSGGITAFVPSMLEL